MLSLGIGPEIVPATSDKVKVIRDKLKTNQSRQKSYVDKRRRDLEFEKGDNEFQRVSPWKGVMRFVKKGKLSPRYIGPFEIPERVVATAYRLALPPDLSQLHDVFHVTMLRKYVLDPSYVLTTQPTELKKDLTYIKQPINILDRRNQVLHTKTIPSDKVLRRSHSVEATWETGENMKNQYPHLFQSGKLNFADKILVRESCETQIMHHHAFD